MVRLLHKARIAATNPRVPLAYLASYFVDSRWSRILIDLNWTLAEFQENIKDSQLPIIFDYSTSKDRFWEDHTTIGPQLAFVITAKQDRKFLESRNQQYPSVVELLRLWDSQGAKTMLEYGCGPGTDMIGFLLQSPLLNFIGVDVSLKALRFAARRTHLHSIDQRRVSLIRVSDSVPTIPIPDNSIDYIFCQGVLHHVSHPEEIVKEFHRILRPSKEATIMVYNRESIWFHLYVAYQQMIAESRFQGLDTEQAFALTTDTSKCPIARCYRPEEFISICKRVGFEASYQGGYYSQLELDTLAKYKEEARTCSKLDREHREFLANLSSNGTYPTLDGKYVGIGGVYILKKGGDAR